MKALEGDLIETFEGLIFDVKGLVHPQTRIIAFIRYFPDEKGGRRRGETFYEKVYSLSKRYELLKKRFPQYLVYDPVFDETLCEVRVADVKIHYNPAEKLRQLHESKSLDDLEKKALQLATLLKKRAKTGWNAIGVSGSILVKLDTLSSDIDLIVYGSKNCSNVYSALGSLLKDENSLVKPYNREELKALFDFRSKDTAMNFESFVRTESRKVLQGKFMETDYFIRFVKDWLEIDENYGDVRYKNVGYGKIEATVVDDSDAIFTPCTYRIDSVKPVQGPSFEPLEEIVSFRGRFCEQARKGEVVVAQGKIERVMDSRRGYEYFRLLIGNQPSDYMILEGQ